MNNSNELHLEIDGGFIGSPYSPRVDITETDSGHEISITSKKPEGIVTDTLEIPDADWQRAEDAREAAESSRVTAENSRKAEWDVISADAASATSAANDAAGSANQAASAANAAAESASDAESDLRAAAARGDFDGFSPVVDIDDGTSSHTITITDREGDHSYTVPTYAAEESARAAAEAERVSAESNRVSAESLRVSAEGLRASAESARANAEAGRVSAESSRRSSENSRVIAETSRANAESSRVSAETARAQAEIARDEAEDLRDSDEQARVSAEVARQTTWAELVDEIEDATDAAELAATAVKPEVDWLRGNVITGEMQGTLDTADDVYAAPPRDVDVYGLSTQDGTPTPDAPVEIRSVVDPVVTFTGKNLLPAAAAGSWSMYGITVTTDGSGTYHVSGTKTVSNGVIVHVPLAEQSGPLPEGCYIHYRNSAAKAGLVVSLNTGSANVGSDYAQTPVNRIVPVTASATGKVITHLNFYIAETGALDVTVTPSVERTNAATDYAPYVGQSVQVLDQPLRSLPDGTEDSLVLTYQGPSEREGWAWYSRELVRRVWEVDLGTLTWSYTGGATYPRFAANLTNQVYPGPAAVANAVCTAYVAISQNDGYSGAKSMGFCINGGIWLWDQTYTDLTSFKTAISGVKLIYQLVTPVTTQLDPIELPVMPSEHATVWCDGGSTQPTYHLTYEVSNEIYDAELITTDDIADAAVNNAKLAQDVKGKFATLNGAVFSNVTESDVVVELKDCMEIVSVDNMADGLTCVGGDNLLPAVVAQTVDKNGVTLTTDSSGTYTAIRVSESQSGAMFLIELPTTVCMPHVDVSYHIGNALANSNVSVGLYDANGTRIHDGAASPANRVMTYSDMGGKVVRYVGIYCAPSFTGSFTIAPMVMLTNVQCEFVPFVGASSAVDSLPSVPDSTMSRIWSNAATETPISVTYITRDGGLSGDVQRLGEIGSQVDASGELVTLDHPSYIDGISAVAMGEPYGGTVTVVGGESMLPPSQAQTVDAAGVTIVSSGDGGYTLSGAATAGKVTQFQLEQPVTLPVSGTLYLHLRNDAVSDLTTIGLADGTGANIGQLSYAAIPVNRVVELPSVLNGKTVAYLSIYHTNTAAYDTPMHLRPIVKPTADADGTERFEGITAGAGDTLATVPSNLNCYVYATDGTPINVAYTVGTDYALAEVDELRDTVNTVSDREVMTALKNARHIPYTHSAEPLTLLHFSDIHADVDALGRIMADAASFGELIDGAICTGDMTSNTYGQITGWWNPDVMTCIGNHDTASYSSSTGFDWTALSMVNRDAYYIAPFESNWGIVHTAGTSYYYKDYADSNVRLIVIDCMLYLGESTASQAASQTSWLASLLADAITSGLHVLIATHAPHNGATSIACSFSRLTQYTAALDTSSNTPQEVIDAVSSAITNGLNFVGYLIGHVHQDYICDAEGDGKQLMYSVTCAAVSYAAQWRNSDQSRDAEMDAYNLVTIDTNNSLVKIVRGGGADMDDAMRPRKAICINYDTGTIVGQTL